MVAPIRRETGEDYGQGTAKYARGFAGVRMCMNNGVVTKLHDHRRELAVAIGAGDHQRA